MIVAGGVCFLVFLLTSIFGFLGAIQRVDVPGFRDLELEAGEHTVYWEVTSRFFKPGGRPDALRVSITRDGAERPLREVGPTKTTYSSGSRAGVSIYSFDVPSKGTYAVRASGTAPGDGVVSVGPAVGLAGILKIVLGCLAMPGIGVAGGVFLIVRSPKASPLPA